MQVHAKRIYEPIEKSDGFRALVDGMWPRGMKKEDAGIDVWAKEIAPSKELRTWFNHDPAKWTEFQQKYRQELANNPEWDNFKQQIAGQDTVTLLFGAKDTEHNQAVVIKSVLEQS